MRTTRRKICYNCSENKSVNLPHVPYNPHAHLRKSHQTDVYLIGIRQSQYDKSPQTARGSNPCEFSAIFLSSPFSPPHFLPFDSSCHKTHARFITGILPFLFILPRIYVDPRAHLIAQKLYGTFDSSKPRGGMQPDAPQPLPPARCRHCSTAGRAPASVDFISRVTIIGLIFFILIPSDARQSCRFTRRALIL